MAATPIDNGLMAACRNGDREAFRCLFETHKDRVYSIALRYTGDPAAAMDISQDTFVKLFTRIEGFRGESSFESWLFRLVVNCCLDHRRRLKRLAPLAEESVARMAAAGDNPAEAAVRQQREQAVRRAVEDLPDDLRMAVVLRYTEGMSYDEIAEALGCPAGTVASRLNRAHRDLARRLRGGY